MGCNSHAWAKTTSGIRTIAVKCHPGESHTNGASSPPPLSLFFLSFFFSGGGGGREGPPRGPLQQPPPLFFFCLRCPFTSHTLVYACQARWAGSRIILEVVRHHTVFAEGHTSTSSQSKKPPDFSGAHFRIVSIVPKKKKVTCNGKGETLQLIQSTTGRKARWNVFRQATSRWDSRGRRKPTEARKENANSTSTGSSCSAHVLEGDIFFALRVEAFRYVISRMLLHSYISSSLFFSSGPGVVRSLAV